MKTTALCLAALLSGAAATAAFAQDAGNSGAASGGQASGQQQTSPSDTGSTSGVLVAIDKDDAPVAPLNLMVSQVGDMTVIGADGKEIGGVSNVLGDENGNAKAIAVDVGGFLGIGKKTVIIGLQDVSLDMGKLKTTLTKQQIEKLPAFDG